MASISGVSTTDINGIDGFYTTQGGGTATVSPSLSVTAGLFGASITVTKSTGGTYTNPNYKIVVEAGGAVIVPNTDVTKSLDSSESILTGDMSWVDSDSASGARTVKVQAQEFGDFVASSVVTTTYNKQTFQHRYLRLKVVTADGSPTTQWGSWRSVRFYDAAGGASGSGTEYPTTNLTSNTSETGIVVKTGHVYSSTTYAAWKACDGSNNTVSWWPLSSAANNYWQINWQSPTYTTAPQIISIVLQRGPNAQSQYTRIQGSDTGAFAGEETDYGVIYLANTSTTYTFG